MTLLSDARRDLATAPAQPRSYGDDPRGPTHGKKWLPDGEAVLCAYMELSTRERFEAGRQESDEMLRIFVDLRGGKSPVTARNRVMLGGREYDVTGVRTIVEPGEDGSIVEAVSV